MKQQRPQGTILGDPSYRTDNHQIIADQPLWNRDQENKVGDFAFAGPWNARFAPANTEDHLLN
jgi:hypothetical protein